MIVDQMPRIVLSLDFEMRWGVHHRYGVDFSGYRQNVEQERHVVPPLLKLFEAHATRVTWAAVGAIGCRNWDDYFSRAPAPPQYKYQSLAVKPEYADLDPNGSLHFAPELFKMILAAPGQDLGTHTFSHLYCREAGLTADDLAADLSAVFKLYAERYGTTPKSMVYPRSQVALLDVARSLGIKVIRGNPGPWYYECESLHKNGYVSRALKLCDGINPFRRFSGPLQGDVTRASMFLRLNLSPYLWRLHVERLKRELDSLEADDIFHLWFHPHNAGRDTALRLSRVEQVLDLIAERQERRRLQSCSMADLVQEPRPSA